MTPTAALPRDLGIDLARGVALLSMFVAHTAPSNGPFDLLLLSEFLTFPLFALLVGVGAELGARAHPVWPHLGRSAVSAVALLGLGWLLAQAGAMVVIVLGQLGVLTLLLWAVVRLPSVVVAGVGMAAAALAPWSLSASREVVLQAALDQAETRSWWWEQWVSMSYPQAVLLSLGCLGILWTRWALPVGRHRSTALLAVLGILLLGAVMLAMVGHLAGLVEVIAYRTQPLEQLVVAALAVGVASLCLVLARWSWRPWQWAVGALAAAGGMTLTLYALHVLWLAFWVQELFVGQADDTWGNVVGMSAVAIALGVGWRALGAPRPWGRGPVEGAVGVVADLVTTERGGRGPREPGDVGAHRAAPASEGHS